jgi:hypothetical protein
MWWSSYTTSLDVTERNPYSTSHTQWRVSEPCNEVGDLLVTQRFGGEGGRRCRRRLVCRLDDEGPSTVTT